MKIYKFEYSSQYSGENADSIHLKTVYLFVKNIFC